VPFLTEQSSSCGSNRKNQGGCREDKISDSRYSAAGKIIIFFVKSKNNIKNKLD